MTVTASRILVAGIGNIFLGDDAFGVEVVRALENRKMPEGVVVKDFGIRSFDLAYALLDPWKAVILVDALPRGEEPGTLYKLEVNPGDFGNSEDVPDAHSMNPVKVLELAQATGQVTARIYVIGCEPGDCGGDEGRMGLTPPIQASVAAGAQMVSDLVQQLCVEKTLIAVP
ncbi:MAG: hydrogenase maturation protease [Terriglobales bacterium]